MDKICPMPHLLPELFSHYGHFWVDFLVKVRSILQIVPLQKTSDLYLAAKGLCCSSWLLEIKCCHVSQPKTYNYCLPWNYRDLQILMDNRFLTFELIHRQFIYYIYSYNLSLSDHWVPWVSFNIRKHLAPFPRCQLLSQFSYVKIRKQTSVFLEL